MIFVSGWRDGKPLPLQYSKENYGLLGSDITVWYTGLSETSIPVYQTVWCNILKVIILHLSNKWKDWVKTQYTAGYTNLMTGYPTKALGNFVLFLWMSTVDYNWAQLSELFTSGERKKLHNVCVECVQAFVFIFLQKKTKTGG